MVTEIALKRVYDDADDADGFRILVDRLWPRGISKDKARVDLWLKDIAPTNELRKSWGHDPDTFDDFTARYCAQLEANTSAVGELIDTIREQSSHAVPRITFVYGAKSPVYNQACVLRDYLFAPASASSHLNRLEAAGVTGISEA